MKIHNKNINEYNIEDYIKERSSKKFSEIYLELKKDVQEKVNGERYSSLPGNYTPIFIYHAINHQIEIDELNMVLQLSENYENGLNRFFEASDVDFDEKKSLWEELSYFFYKKEDNKIVIDKSKIKYIEVFCNNVRDKNLLDFHSSRIDYFISRYLYKNPEYINELSTIVKSNPVLQKSEHYKYASLHQSIFKILADSSYELDLGNLYKKIKEDKFLCPFMSEYLIGLDYNKKYKSNLSFIEMVSKNDVDFIYMFQNRVKEIKSLLSDKEFTELLSDCSYSMIDMMKNKDVVLDINRIDLKEEFRINIPFVLYMKGRIDNENTDKIININEDFIQYMKTNIEILSEKFKDDYDFEDMMLMRKLDMEKISKYLDYKRLDDKLKTNHFIEKKVKI